MEAQTTQPPIWQTIETLASLADEQRRIADRLYAQIFNGEVDLPVGPAERAAPRPKRSGLHGAIEDVQDELRETTDILHRMVVHVGQRGGMNQPSVSFDHPNPERLAQGEGTRRYAYGGGGSGGVYGGGGGAANSR